MAFAIYLVSLVILVSATYARLVLEGAALRSVWGLSIFLLAFLIPFAGFVWAAVFAWRNLARSKRTTLARSNHSKLRRFLFSNMAEAGQIVILLTSMLVLLWGAVVELPTTKATATVAKQMLFPPCAPYRIWYSKPTGQLLHVEGVFAKGIADAVAQAIRARPATRLVILDSPGGLLDEGLRMARIIRQSGLDTGVDKHCESACTFAFMGGVQRILIPPGRLGFHGCRDVLRFLPCDNRDGRAFMKTHEVDADFVRKALLRTAPESIWYPSTDELMKAGVVTRLDVSGIVSQHPSVAGGRSCLGPSKAIAR